MSRFSKHLDLHLDSKFTFDVHIKTVLTKVNRTSQSAKRYVKDALKMSYEDTLDISKRCLLDA